MSVLRLPPTGEVGDVDSGVGGGVSGNARTAVLAGWPSRQLMAINIASPLSLATALCIYKLYIFKGRACF